MNRAQRRAEIKNVQRKYGFSREKAKETVEQYYAHANLEEGTKVKLNWELIHRSPDFKKQREDYRKWCSDHRDDVFTVQWDEKRKANNTKDKKQLVCLAEDETEPKWLFYTSTLIPQSEVSVKMNDGTKIDAGTIGTGELNNETINKAIEEALAREAEQNAEQNSGQNSNETGNSEMDGSYD